MIIKNKIFWVVLAMAGGLSILASSWPDGLGKVMAQSGLSSHASGVLPEYLFPGIQNRLLAGSLAGLLGVAIIFLLFWFLEKILIKKED